MTPENAAAATALARTLKMDAKTWAPADRRRVCEQIMGRYQSKFDLAWMLNWVDNIPPWRSA